MAQDDEGDYIIHICEENETDNGSWRNPRSKQ